MEYKVYCIVKNEQIKQNNKVVRVRVIANCITEALNKAKDMLLSKLKSQNCFQIFMYETVADK